MSCTTVYAAFEDGDMVELGECQNSWRGSMWIWTKLGEKHLGAIPSIMDMAPVWRLAAGDKLSETEWYALMSTFDGCLCPRELMLKVAEALEGFSPGTENLVKQAQLIRDAWEENARAIGWLQTSVCGSPWQIYSEDDEGYHPWNIDRDMANGIAELEGKKAWFMEAKP